MVNETFVVLESKNIPRDECIDINVKLKEEEWETLEVNGKYVTVRKFQHAKTILSIFCNQNNLNHPNYVVNFVNERSKEWLTFELDGKSVSGSGRKKRQTESAAARKYLDGNFLTGEVSSQSGKSFKSTKNRTFHPQN